MKDEKKIRITFMGPYEVDASIPLNQASIVPAENEEGASERWETRKEYPECENGVYKLCRCGHSRTKPHCDGTHNDVSFLGKETAPHDPYAGKSKCYSGEGIDLFDTEGLCAVMRFCDRAPTAWRAARDSHDAGKRDLAVDAACKCASGRLRAFEKDGTPIEPELSQEISVVEDLDQGCRGPLWVKGGIAIEGSDGKAYAVRNRVTLCRCGESKNIPFCDASHLKCSHMKGFDD